VSLVPAVTEMLFAVGAGTQVVGVSSYDHFPPEVEKLPKVGALIDPDTERILSLRPDLVVVYGSQTDTEARFKRRVSRPSTTGTASPTPSWARSTPSRRSAPPRATRRRRARSWCG
jgi:hypothetical protein